MEESSVPPAIDRIDRKILRRLQADGRASNADLAKAANVSPATCHRRTQRLFDIGAIRGVRADIDPATVDKQMMAVVGVTLERSTPESFQSFEAAIAKFSFIIDCLCVAGEFDYFLTLRSKDIDEFNKTHRTHLLTLPDVRQLRSFFVLKEVVTDAPLQF